MIALTYVSSISMFVRTLLKHRSFPGKDHFGIAGPVPENAIRRSRLQQPSHIGGECVDTVAE
jgi:hypothetical protein